ncbi:hypothetical protein [Streptomyces halobius]|nr:hypothetical protein [Streptomyces halobius]
MSSLVMLAAVLATIGSEAAPGPASDEAYAWRKSDECHRRRA